MSRTELALKAPNPSLTAENERFDAVKSPPIWIKIGTFLL
jgi:hypothetical protein